MNYPQQTIPFEQLLNYLNTEWVTNGMGLITGVVGNNATNSLAQGIIMSPINASLVEIINTTASKQVTHPVNYFYVNIPANVVFGDNFQNEWVFINSLNSEIPFSNGLGYFDLDFTFQTTIPLRSLLRISKATNGLWIQTGTYGTSPFTSNTKWENFTNLIGTPSGDSLVPSVNDGDMVVTVPYQVEQGSETWWYNGTVVDDVDLGDIFFTPTYNAATTDYTFSQPLQDGLKLKFKGNRKLSSGSTIGQLQAVAITPTTTGRYLVLDFAFTFVSLDISGNSYYFTDIPQVDDYTLDFNNLGGVPTNIPFMLFYYPK